MTDYVPIHKITTRDQMGTVRESETRSHHAPEQSRASIEENPFDWNNASIVAQDTKMVDAIMDVLSPLPRTKETAK